MDNEAAGSWDRIIAGDHINFKELLTLLYALILFQGLFTWASRAVPLRFHDRSKLYQEYGRPDIQVVCARRGHLGSGILTQHTGPCQAPGRLPEHRGRPPVTPAAPLRMDDGVSGIQTNRLHFRPPFSRSFRIYDYHPTPEI